ncbi:MAG: iron-containing alcohol dehydrogenase [Oscillospiraceae bacterium]|nr:iron-containing alcohol dehydrogenase [Oscillospiraceae bacterium]
MENFAFDIPTRTVFGKGAQNEVGKLIKSYGGSKVLLHYGGGSIKKSGLYDDVVASLRESGLDFVELGGVVPQPDLKLVYKGIELAKKEKTDFILAVGGGSTIDSAKAIGLGYYFDGDIWDVYTKGAKVEKTLPVGNIITIPAAGSESSNSSVITNYEKKHKQGYGNELIRPIFCIMNPELFFTLPKNQIAFGVADIMSHILERYFTVSIHTDLIDGMAESILKTIMSNALIIINDPKNYDAWCQVGLGGSFAHNNLLGIGRVQAWACHPMCNKLSSTYGVAHGEALAVITPAWMEYVYKENIGMFTQFAVNVMGVESSYREADTLIMDGINRLRAFFRQIGAPAKWSDTSVKTDDFETIAKQITVYDSGSEKPVSKNGMKELYWQDVLNIYKMCI